MKKIDYFINKLWIFITSFHPMSYLTLFVMTGILYLIFRKLILLFKPQLKNKNVISMTLVLTIGLPLIFLTIYFIIWLLLRNQQF